MIDEDRIALLEALLARVQSRSRAPQGFGPSAPLPPLGAVRASAFDVPTPMGAFRPSSIPPPEPPPPPPSAPASSPKARPKHTSRPEVPAAFYAMRPPEPSQIRAIEPPPMEVVELEVDPDPSLPPPPISSPAFDDFAPAFSDTSFGDRGSGQLPAEPALESRSRLVSAPPSAPNGGVASQAELAEPLDALDVGDEPPGHIASDPTIEVAAAEVSRAELDALEEERAPTSSRRPISMEEKMNELEDPIPLHAPPPESGRLPAASPTFELAFAEASVSVVRVEPEPQASVAVFIGPAPTAARAMTFGELLDDALSI